MGKFAGGAGGPGGGGGLQVPQGKFCKPCGSSTHWESQCWGVCQFCSRRGHKSEWCHAALGKELIPIPPGDQEQAKAAGEKKKAKKVDLPGGEAGGATGGATSSDSESESPTRNDLPDPGAARANRVNFVTANKAVRSDLNKKLSVMTLEEVQEVFRAMRAVKNDSPMTNTKVYKKIKERNGVTATCCWDTSCTFPISSLAVIKQISFL